MPPITACSPLLAPCSPHPGGRAPESCSPPPPLSSGGGEHEGRPEQTPTTGLLAPLDRGEHNPSFRPGSVWLITDRTRPAWTAVLDLLDDDQWHPTTEVAQAMRAAANLTPRTIAAHLLSAGRRSWITTRHGKTRLRDRDLIEAALGSMETGR